MTHIRLRIIKGIQETLAAISQVGGYNHDLGGRVHRGRLLYGSESETPFISILEDPDQEMPEQKAAHPAQIGSLKLVIQGWVEDDKEEPLDPAYPLMADVKRALHRAAAAARGNHTLFGGTQRNQVNGLIIGRGTVRPSEEEAPDVGFVLPIVVEYVENLEDPFS